jgi:TRAP-type C4-dicarboxylate transport system substrate-binding protein
MRKLLSLTLCLFLLALQPAQAQPQTKSFKIATIAPDGTHWMEELKSAAAEIEKKTQGRVSFRFYPGGVMGNDKSVLRKIRVGQLHGGAVTGGGLVDVYPDAQVYSLPLAFRSYEEVDYVRQRMDKPIIDGLRENGFISFGLSEGGFAYLMSAKPLNKMSDLKQYKVWSPEGDQFSRSAFEAIGISPIPLPLTDVLTGLQTGMIDTVAASSMGAIALQWHSKVKYLNTTPLMYLYGTLIIQRKAFEELSADDQRTVTTIMQATFSRLDGINRKDNEQALQALKQQGIQFVQPGAEEQKQWQNSVASSMKGLTSKNIISNEMTQLLQSHTNEFRTTHR